MVIILDSEKFIVLGTSNLHIVILLEERLLIFSYAVYASSGIFIGYAWRDQYALFPTTGVIVGYGGRFCIWVMGPKGKIFQFNNQYRFIRTLIHG